MVSSAALRRYASGRLKTLRPEHHRTGGDRIITPPRAEPHRLSPPRSHGHASPWNKVSASILPMRSGCRRLEQAQSFGILVVRLDRKRVQEQSATEAPDSAAGPDPGEIRTRRVCKIALRGEGSQFGVKWRFCAPTTLRFDATGIFNVQPSAVPLLTAPHCRSASRRRRGTVLALAWRSLNVGAERSWCRRPGLRV
jgi:hypothetical protein